MSESNGDDASTSIESEQARKAVAFLAANLEAGIDRKIALSDVIAAAALEGATEAVDLTVNIGKLLGGMALVAHALMELRHREQKSTPAETVELLRGVFGVG